MASTILMEGDKVLLIQEADPRIKGTWYLPAGLVDPHETIAVRVCIAAAAEPGGREAGIRPPPPPGKIIIHAICSFFAQSSA